jgi:(p)ppGpp synthase/HD superfamily hydrolase
MFGDFNIALPTATSFEKEWFDFRVFAIRCHGGQLYGTRPYAYHLAMVEHYLIEFGYTEHQYQAAAWLHDALEDTGLKLDRINQNYGPVVAAIVHACTGEGLNRKARNQSIYKKLAQYPIAAPVKVADRLANTISSFTEARHTFNTEKLEMYVNEWDEFRKKVFPLVLEQRRGRLLWESLESLVESAKVELPELKARKAELDAKEASKSGQQPSA